MADKHGKVIPEVSDLQHGNEKRILTMEHVTDPSLNSDKPVSHQFEEAYYVFYGWPNYWGGP